MAKALFTIEEQRFSLEECIKLLTILSEFVCEEGLKVETSAVAAGCFFQRMPTYYPLITVTMDKIKEVCNVLNAVVEDGFKAVREKRVAENTKGVNV